MLLVMVPSPRACLTGHHYQFSVVVLVWQVMIINSRSLCLSGRSLLSTLDRYACLAGCRYQLSVFVLVWQLMLPA